MGGESEPGQSSSHLSDVPDSLIVYIVYLFFVVLMSHGNTSAQWKRFGEPWFLTISFTVAMVLSAAGPLKIFSNLIFKYYLVSVLFTCLFNFTMDQ